MLLVIFPVALIFATVGPIEDPFAMPLAFIPVALILATVVIIVDSLAVLLAINHIALINLGTVGTIGDAYTMNMAI